MAGISTLLPLAVMITTILISYAHGTRYYGRSYGSYRNKYGYSKTPSRYYGMTYHKRSKSYGGYKPSYYHDDSYRKKDYLPSHVVKSYDDDLTKGMKGGMKHPYYTNGDALVLSHDHDGDDHTHVLLGSKLGTLGTGIGTLGTGVGKYETGIRKLGTGMGTDGTGMGKLGTGLGKYGTGLGTLGTGLSAYGTGKGTLGTGLDTLGIGVGTGLVGTGGYAGTGATAGLLNGIGGVNNNFLW